MTPRTLFVAGPPGASAWYRIALPAERLGADWIAVDAGLAQVGGAVGVTVPFEQWFGYDAVVLQQPRGAAWLQRIAALRAAGVTVLHEADGEGPARKETEQVLRACDGAIFATDWLARQFRGAARAARVCRSGLDLERFAVSRVDRPAVHIGWAGAQGSHTALLPWLGAVKAVLAARPGTRFVSIGVSVADALAEVAPERRMTIPPSLLECYPAALSLLDVALAPTDGSRAFRAKSDLRFLEAAAVGAAVVGDPRLYGTIEDGVTGLHARTPTEARDAILALVDDAALRRRFADAARAYVEGQRSIDVAAGQWAEALRELVPARAAVAR
jgi:glycosyltransferase involved in cell wall biosynthesis